MAIDHIPIAHTQAQSGAKHALRNFLIVAVLLSIAVPAAISGSFLIWVNYTKTVDEDSRATAESYADFLEAGMTTPLWNLTPDMGKPLVESVFVDNAVRSVQVFNEKGDLFLDYHHKENVKPSNNVLVITRDIHFQDSYLGKLVLIYSMERAQQRASNEARLLAIIIVAQLIFSVVVVSIVLQKYVFSPIKKLSNAAHNITLGDLKTSIPKSREDEIGDVADQFETMRNALNNSFDLLETRVQERTVELSNVNNELKGTLTQLQQTQDNLIQSEKLAALGSLVAGVAHELNTPIGNGLTVATTLQEQYNEFEKELADGVTKSSFDRFVENVKEGVGIITRNLARASELVISFKQVAVDQTSAQRRRFSLQALMNETILTIQPAFKRTPFKITLLCETDAELNSYPGPLVQVLTNLINNAVLHGFGERDHGLVEVVANAEAAPANRVKIQIKDDGQGIPEEHLNKIFEPFFTTKLGEGGSGLGLHITHNIVTGVLGGSIEIQSTVGRGTEFTLYIPLQAPTS